MPLVGSLNKRAFSAIAVALALTAAPVDAARAQSSQGAPEELLEEGTKKILRAFELFILTIPQYEMPEVLPNGDIIIRRKNPPTDNKDDAPTDGEGKTKT